MQRVLPGASDRVLRDSLRRECTDCPGTIYPPGATDAARLHIASVLDNALSGPLLRCGVWAASGRGGDRGWSGVRGHGIRGRRERILHQGNVPNRNDCDGLGGILAQGQMDTRAALDRKSTRLNSSHSQISYAVFCLKKKTTSAYRGET